MKKILLFAIVAIVGFAACKKSSSSNSYYIKATINGISYNYNGQVYSNPLSTVTGNYYVVLLADSSSSNNSGTGFEMDLYGNNVAPGTYSNKTTSSNGVQFTWNTFDSSYTSADTSAVPTITCIVTIVNSTYISGTFSGTLYNADSSVTKTITNGSFCVPHW